MLWNYACLKRVWKALSYSIHWWCLTSGGDSPIQLRQQICNCTTWLSPLSSPCATPWNLVYGGGGSEGTPWTKYEGRRWIIPCEKLQCLHITTGRVWHWFPVYLELQQSTLLCSQMRIKLSLPHNCNIWGPFLVMPLVLCFPAQSVLLCIGNFLVTCSLSLHPDLFTGGLVSSGMNAD